MELLMPLKWTSHTKPHVTKQAVKGDLDYKVD